MNLMRARQWTPAAYLAVVLIACAANVAARAQSAVEPSLSDLQNTQWNGVYTNREGRTMGHVYLSLQQVGADGFLTGTITTNNLDGSSPRTEPIEHATLDTERHDRYVFEFESQLAGGHTGRAKLEIDTKGKHAGTRMAGIVEFGAGEVRYKLDRQ